ncbi:MAG: family 16 glycoside hydrolase [Isosphaeraceae bacterium]
MSRFRVTAIVLGGLLAVVPGIGRQATAAESEEAGFVPLFDGKSFDGWKKVGGGATYRIENGEIVGEVGPGPNTFLRTEKTYGDFILKVDAKLDVASNSGIQFRSHQKDGNGRVFGYQCEIDPSPRAWTAGIYDEGRRGWLYPLNGHPEAQKAFRLTDWNSFVIEARGPWIRTWLNGVPCADLIDTADLDGLIALQVHAAKEGRIRWRNVRLKDLGQSHWKPIKPDAWKSIGEDQWSIKDANIRGTRSAKATKPGVFVTNDSFGDVALRLQFKDQDGACAVLVRGELVGDADVKGFQVQPSHVGGVGELHETDGHTPVFRAKPEDITKWLKPKDWNELTVVALGNRYVVHLNSQKITEAQLNSGQARGRIALKLQGDHDANVEFKNVEIQDLSDIHTNH